MIDNGIEVFDDALPIELGDTIISIFENERVMENSGIKKLENIEFTEFQDEWDMRYKTYINELDIVLDMHVNRYYEHIRLPETYTSVDLSERKLKTFDRCDFYKIQKNNKSGITKKVTEDDNIPFKNRQVSVIWFLDDSDSNLYFPHQDHRIEIQTGRMVIFPVSYLYSYIIEDKDDDVYSLKTYLTNFGDKWRHDVR